ncbi:MFS transporter [Gordonia malaquae]|uniref:Putative major facilitator superfamily transporter n=1 Tax=Gordonia malaquae NBRC 108250 TaxID=1223542 RepID=M3VBZ8_GORML|nr:MFS transporter [Gordonia malaquae]GAC81138.1 putative major facilitator superfamily transporter [Gordonia malaquae NBRC 108250]
MSTAMKAGSRRWLTLFTVAWLVIWMVQLTPLQLLLPLQLDQENSQGGDEWIHTVVISGLILGAGGLAGVIAGPLAGAWSDRTDSSRLPEWLGGRRRVWSLIGTWLMAVFLVLVGITHSTWVIGGAWIGVCIGVGVASASFTALIADQLPDDQRGSASAAVGASQALGIVVGVGVIGSLGLDPWAGYLILAVLITVVGTWATLRLPDPPVDHLAAQNSLDPDRGRWDSLRDKDFSWMLAGRFIANVGNALGTSLFLFFLLYGLDQDKDTAEGNLILLVVVYTVFVVIASIVSGSLADRGWDRRGLTIVSALIQSLSGLIIVISPTFTATMIGAAFMGVGYGAFSTAGLAYATDLLPHEDDHGRDLGIVNTTAALGQLVGPVLGAGLVSLVGGFWLVFFMGFVLSIVGALVTLGARKVPAVTRISST